MERVVPEASLQATATPVDRYVAPVVEHATKSRWEGAAEALSLINPELKKFLKNRNDENAATEEAEGERAAMALKARAGFNENRDNWSDMIKEVRREDPALADRMAGASPHFRRGLYRSKLNRIGMGLNDHLINLWRENPTVDGQNLHDIDDPMVIDEWMRNEANKYSERYGVGAMDPLLVQQVYQKRVDAAMDGMMSRHTDFRLNRYQEEYAVEFDANVGALLTGHGSNASDVGDYMEKMGWSESSFRWSVENDLGYKGAFQIGEDRLADYNRANGTNITLSQFTNTPEGRDLQLRVMRWTVEDVDKLIQSKGYLEQGWSLDGLRAVAHLGGKAGMVKFVETEGKYNPDDGYTKKDGTKVKGTKLSDYYTKFSGPAPEIQSLLNAAIKDGMNPSKANKALVDQVILSAVTDLNEDLLDVVMDIDTGNGPLGNVGWVREQVEVARRQIVDRKWKAEEREYTIAERERVERAASVDAEANSILFADASADVSDLIKQHNDNGFPEKARALATFQESLIDRDFKVRDDHEYVTDLRIRSLEMGDDRFYAEIRDGVGVRFSSATAASMMDDYQQRDRYNDLYGDRQIQDEIKGFGRWVSKAWRVRDDRTDELLDGSSQGAEAETYMKRWVFDLLYNDPSITKGDLRDAVIKEAERLRRSGLWQPDERDMVDGYYQGSPSSYGALMDRAEAGVDIQKTLEGYKIPEEIPHFVWSYVDHQVMKGDTSALAELAAHYSLSGAEATALMAAQMQRN